MSAHAANSRLATSFSVQSHTTARSPPIETGNAADNGGYSGKRDGGGVFGPRDPLVPSPCNGGRPSAAPCSATANSAKSVSPSSGVSASDYYAVSKNGQGSATSSHTNSAFSDLPNTSTSPKPKDANFNSEGCGSGGNSGVSGSNGGVNVLHSARGHNLSSLGERSSPAAVRRAGSESSRESRMDAANFRLRLRKCGGEGVTKKGPLVAKHPSSTNPTTTTSSTTVSASTPTASSTNTTGGAPQPTPTTKEVRSPVGQGPLPLASHRRRPGSPDPRGHGRTRPSAPRDSPRSSPKTSPRSSPRSSPVRQLHRERSASPRRYVGRGSSVGGVASRGQSTRATPSPPAKRATPPTSPRVRRQRSPSTSSGSGAARRNPSPKVSEGGGGLKPRQKRGASPSARPPSTPTSPLTSPISPAARTPPSPTPTPLNNNNSASTRPPSPGARRPPSPTGGSGARPPSPGSRRPPSPRGTSPRGRGASPGSRGPPISEEALRARVRRTLRARLYLLHQPGPNSFTVGGDSPSHKYKVIIGPQVSAGVTC
ncbi:uncharacterized protein [Panulirus ornatus]|uniref:uncharacterized protein n=1 Tax=Panulirus ornatus TaxID=150431 RepID=UPI003A8A8D78